MPTIGNKKNYDNIQYEEMIYRQQLMMSWGKSISELHRRNDSGQIMAGDPQPIIPPKRRKK